MEETVHDLKTKIRKIKKSMTSTDKEFDSNENKNQEIALYIKYDVVHNHYLRHRNPNDSERRLHIFLYQKIVRRSCLN